MSAGVLALIGLAVLVLAVLILSRACRPTPPCRDCGRSGGHAHGCPSRPRGRW